VFWRLIKTLIFTFVMPGTFGVYVPQALKSGGMELPTTVRIVGLMLAACGTAIYLWCAWDFVSKGLGTPAPIDAPRVLVVKGLYRFTRNPMYVGVSALILGQAAYYRSGKTLVYLCFVVTAFHLFVRFYEEPTLRRLFGEQYEEYRRKVPRWIFRLSKT